jgi:Tol biopolymer transport system component
MKQAAIVAVVLVLTGFVAARQDVSDVFYKAVHLQDVKGDLEAAIPLFEQVVAESQDPSLAAKAQLRIGMCYEKLGLTRAQQAYQRVIDRYPRQSQEVAAARARIAALSQAGATAVVTRQVWTDAPGGVYVGAPSPDGRYITYVDYGSGNLAVRDLRTDKNSPLTAEGSWDQPEQLAEYSRWSPDGKQAVYAWSRGSEVELRIVSIDDRRTRVLYRNNQVTWIGPQDWSPDGRHVLATISRKFGPDQLGLISVADGSLRWFETDAAAARFSPDGRFIVYERRSGDGTGGDLFVMTVDGTSDGTLVNHPADDSLVGWSPDGNWVVFCSDRTGSRGLWMLPVTGGKPAGEPRLVKSSIGKIKPLGVARDGSFYYADVKEAYDIYAARIDLSSGKVLAPPAKVVQRFEGTNQNPAFSPDGRSLAFVSKRGQMVFPTNRGNALCVQSLASGSERVFFDEFRGLGVRYIAGGRWSPDSRSILVGGWGSKNGIYSVDIETGKVELVIESRAGTSIVNTDWARDGRGVFYVRRDRSKDSSQILYRDLKTGDDRELYVGPSQDRYQIAASPDGRWLSFMYLGSNGGLRTIPTSGGTAREIYRFGQRSCNGPQWTPDGKSVMVSCEQRGKVTQVLCRIPIEGGTIQELGLEANIWDRVSLHPDGQRIAYTVANAPDSTSDVWVMSNFLPKTGANGVTAGTENPRFTQVTVATALPNTGGRLSPDGTRYAFVSGGSLWVAPFSRSGSSARVDTPVRLTQPMDALDIGGALISWSRDGQWIAFRAVKPGTPDNPAVIYVVASSGGQPRQVALTENLQTFYCYPVAVSPDGRKVYHVDGAPGQSRIYETTVGTSERRAVTEPDTREPAVSPDGSWLAYLKLDVDVRSQLRRPRQLLVKSLSGGSPILVTEEPAGGFVSSPTWSPDGRTIALLVRPPGSEVVEPTEIRVVPLGSDHRPSGTPATLPLRANTNNPIAGWTGADEIGLLFKGPQNSGLYAVPAAGGQAVQITDRWSTFPNWSPDGSTIYYRADGDTPQWGLFHVGAEGGRRSEVPFRGEALGIPIPGGGPSLSSDGTRLCFVGVSKPLQGNPFPNAIYVIDASGGQPVRLTEPGADAVRAPTWSPDGSQIAFTRAENAAGEPAVNLFVIPATGGQPRQITVSEDRVEGSSAAWSPDGELIAYLGRDNALRVVPAAGGPSRVLASNLGNLRGHGVAWSPDARQIAFTAGNRIFTIGRGGGEPREIKTGLSGAPGQLDWSRDGKRLVFEFDTSRNTELWLMTGLPGLKNTPAARSQIR